MAVVIDEVDPTSAAELVVGSLVQPDGSWLVTHDQMQWISGAPRPPRAAGLQRRAVSAAAAR